MLTGNLGFSVQNHLDGNFTRSLQIGLLLLILRTHRAPEEQTGISMESREVWETPIHCI